jgi:pimeloyl-ACP methyl ester carboxylesterase
MTLARGVADAANVAASLDEPVDVLLGHSWGGAVAILAGARLPVARVVTVDPMIRQVSVDWYDDYLAELRELFALTGNLRDARVREDYRDWSAPDVEGKVHAVHAMTAAPIAGLLRENPPDGWDLRENIFRYEKPLLLAFGAPGESINDEQTLEQIERDRPASVRIARVPNAGHNLHRTAFEDFVRVLDNWLALSRVTP